MTRARRRRALAIAGAFVAAGALAAALAAVALTSSPEESEDAVRMAVVGDSLSQGDSRDFAAGDLGELSWVPWALGDGVEFAGGWAVSGSTTAQMLAAVEQYDADVLVVLAGTNDLALGVDPDETAANLARIVEVADVPRVVLVAIPPNDFRSGDEVSRFNAALAQLAQRNGWEFADASAPLRTEDNRFREGLTIDGIHPSVEGARLLGEGIRAAVRE